MAESHDELTCQEVVELVTDYLEGALPPGETALFEEHLRVCDGCRHYLDQMQKTVASVGRIQEENLPAETRERLVAAFRGWKQP
jgi:predicted anti-sigma-YlaC factor YlaD